MKGWAVLLTKDNSGEHTIPCVCNDLYSYGATALVKGHAIYKKKSDAKLVRDGYRDRMGEPGVVEYEVVPASVVCDVVKVKSFKVKEEYKR